MLQKMRDKSQGWFLWLVVIGISALFALWGIGSYLTPESAKTKAVASVSGHKITQFELNQAVQQMQNEMARSGQDVPSNTTQLRQQALDNLVMKNVLLSSAEDTFHFSLSRTQADELIYQLPAFQENGHFSQARYQQILSQSGFNTQQLREDIRSSVLINQVKFGIENSQFLLGDELDKVVSLLGQRRDLGFYLLKSDNFKNYPQVTEAEIKDYYDSHGQDFINPEKVQLQYVELSLDHMIKHVTISDQDAKNYFEQNQTTYVYPEKRQVSQILISLPENAKADAVKKAEVTAQKVEALIKKGKSFAALAKQYSKDAISARKGGDIGTITLSQDPTAFELAAFALQKVGDVSKPIKTKYGLQIVKLTKINPAQQKPFSEVKAQILSRMKRQQAEMLFSSKGEKLSTLAFENPDSLKFVSDELSLPIQTTGWITKKGGEPKVTKSPKVLKAAFSDEVLKDKNNSDVINLSDTDAVVVRVLKHASQSQKSLAEVKPEIEKVLIHAHQMATAKSMAEKISKQIKAGQSKTTISQAHKLTWTQKKGVERNSAKINPEILAAAFNESRASVDEKLVKVVPVQGQGYAVLQVLSITQGSDHASAKQLMPFYSKALEQIYAAQDYNAYATKAKETAKIKYAK